MPCFSHCRLAQGCARAQLRWLLLVARPPKRKAPNNGLPVLETTTSGSSSSLPVLDAWGFTAALRCHAAEVLSGAQGWEAHRDLSKPGPKVWRCTAGAQ